MFHLANFLSESFHKIIDWLLCWRCWAPYSKNWQRGALKNKIILIEIKKKKIQILLCYIIQFLKIKLDVTRECTTVPYSRVVYVMFGVKWKRNDSKNPCLLFLKLQEMIPSFIFLGFFFGFISSFQVQAHFNALSISFCLLFHFINLIFSPLISCFVFYRNKLSKN